MPKLPIKQTFSEFENIIHLFRIPNTVTRVAGWGRSTNNYKNDLGISDALTAYLQYVIIPVKTVDQCVSMNLLQFSDSI